MSLHLNGTDIEIDDDAVISRQVAINGIGQRATLYGPNAHHAGADRLGGGNQVAGAGRAFEIL